MCKRQYFLNHIPFWHCLLSYYALTFYYDFEEEDDEVFFAYCPPYTYTNLMDNIQLIQKN